MLAKIESPVDEEHQIMKKMTLHRLSAQFSGRAVALASLGIAAALLAPPAFATPNIWDYVLPTTVTKLTAVGRTRSADQKELAVIGKDFGDAYRLREATYTFTAPDRLE